METTAERKCQLAFNAWLLVWSRDPSPNLLVPLSVWANTDKGPVCRGHSERRPCFRVACLSSQYPDLQTTMAGFEIPAYEMPSLVTPTTLIRSQDVWYDDGNVVIQTENIVFKVFRGILASNSAVFADMFSVPQPTNVTGPDVYDSCPLIQIYDTPEDARHFLKAIHDAGSACFVLKHRREGLIKCSGTMMSGPPPNSPS